MLTPTRRALRPHRLPRGPLLQGAARRHLRARLLPERDHLGLRLRRPRPSRVAGEARHTSSCYAKTPSDYVFNADEIDRIPYMAPGLVGPEKAARGKLPTDTWWHTIVSPTGKEKTGYPTQKPLGDPARGSSRASSHPGDLVLDFFAGSGTTGAAAACARPALPAGRRQRGGAGGHGPTLPPGVAEFVELHAVAARRG